MKYIIEIKVDGTVTGTVGIFDDEDAADRYVDSFLAPSCPQATFHITDIIDPLDFLAILLELASGNLPGPVRPLSYFEDKYGPDFKHKLPHYRTAHFRGQAVSIMQLDIGRLEALVVAADRKVHRCNVRELDNFVL